MNIGPVDYGSGTTPEGYRCGACGAHGCKLWRRFGGYAELRCLICCGHRPRDIDARGQMAHSGLVPAIPCEEGGAIWGFFCGVARGKAWWDRLPTVPAANCPEGGDPELWGLYVFDVGPIAASAPHVVFGIEVGEEP